MSTEPRTRAWVEVSGAALRGNLRRIREAAGPGSGVLPMVKADAYGLGVGAAVRALEPESPWGYGVATVPEGIELRRLGVERPVLVVSPVPAGAVPDAVEADLALGVSTLDAVETVQAAARGRGARASIHVEVDTGMGRAGFDWRRAKEWGARIAERTGGRIAWSGVYTHLHSADEADPEPVEVQARRFQDALEALPPPTDGERIVHICNSAGALRRPDLARDLVRPGIFLYGGRAGAGLPPPREVVRVRGRIVLVREVPPGTTVGYGATYRSEGWETWGTVAIGYGDGLRRALGNRGQGILGGRRVPIVGRISMDTTVVDLSDTPDAVPGDPVTFVGTDGGETISLEEVAGHVGTISYEVLTGLTPRLPRIWLEEGGA